VCLSLPRKVVRVQRTNEVALAHPIVVSPRMRRTCLTASSRDLCSDNTWIVRCNCVCAPLEFRDEGRNYSGIARSYPR
jgi:hypothetical protein